MKKQDSFHYDSQHRKLYDVKRQWRRKGREKSSKRRESVTPARDL